MDAGCDGTAIKGLIADGSPVYPEREAAFPSGLENMNVLVVFWSLNDTGDVGLVQTVKALRREFGRGRFQIVSICVDDDWSGWLKFLAREGRMTYGSRSVDFASDAIWCQLTQAGSGANCAADFRVTTTPATFLIQPNGRFFAVNIPLKNLRATVAKALDWDAD